MPNDPILEAVKFHVENLDDLKEWLIEIKADPNFAPFYTEPIISMLTTACDYLKANIDVLRQRYVVKIRK